MTDLETYQRQEDFEHEILELVEQYSDLSYKDLQGVLETVLLDLRSEPYER
jgi:hypothetical protein